MVVAIMAAALVVAVIATPVTVYLMLRFGTVGGTPREIAEETMRVNQQLAERKIKMDEERHAIEMKANETRLTNMQNGPQRRHPGIQNLDRV